MMSGLWDRPIDATKNVKESMIIDLAADEM